MGDRIPHFKGRTRLVLGLVALAAVVRGDDVRLAWDPNTEADLAGYRLYWGPGSRAYTRSRDLGLVTTAEVTNLFGAPVFFAVTAYNTAGLESEPSNEVSVDPADEGTNAPPASLRPGPIQDFRVEPMP